MSTEYRVTPDQIDEAVEKLLPAKTPMETLVINQLRAAAMDRRYGHVKGHHLDVLEVTRYVLGLGEYAQ